MNKKWAERTVNFQPLYLPVCKLNQDDTIITRCTGRFVYSKFIMLLFLLAASCDGRGSACSQDAGSNMGYLWFTVQIWAKWSYKTIFTVWVHYNQQYNILKLKKKAKLRREISSVQFWKKWARGIKRTNGKEHAMNTQPMLPSSSDHLLKLTKGPIFIATYYTLRDTSAFWECPWNRLQLWVIFNCLYKYGQNIEELRKFLYTFFTTFNTRYSYN